MRYFIALAFSLSLSRVALAAGGANGGSLHPLQGRHDSIHLVRENITMYFKESDFSTLIEYEFKNEGSSQIVAMAVPENDYAFSPSKSRLTSFSVYVDGFHRRIKRHIVNRKRVFPAPNALWIIKVSFHQGQTRHIRVRYQSDVWGSCALGTYYMFANNKWKGKVEKGKVENRTLTLVDCSLKGDIGFEAGVPFRRKGRRYYYRWLNANNIGTLGIATIYGEI